MDRNQILTKLQLIFQETLENKELILNEDMQSTDVQGWDSLSHINLIENIEKSFNIQFSIGEIVTLKNIADMISIIQNKL